MNTTSSVDGAGPSRLVILASFFIVTAIWSSTWLVIKSGLEDLPPFLSAGVRFLVAGVVMTGVVLVLSKKEGGLPPPWWLSAVMGTTNFGISYGATYWAESVLASGVVSVLWSVLPILIAIQAHFWLSAERLRTSQALGFLVAFSGVIVLFLTDLRAQGPRAILFALIGLIGPVVASVGTVLVKHHGRRVNSLRLNRDGMLIGAAWLLGASAFTDGDAIVRWTPNALLSIAYLAIMGTVVTFGLYFWLMKWVPAYRMSLISYLIPPFALVLGAVLGNEPLTVSIVSGTALILLGVWAANGRRR